MGGHPVWIYNQRKKSLEHFENQACAFDVDQYVQAGTLINVAFPFPTLPPPINQYCDGFGDMLNMFAFLNTVRFHLKTCI